MIKPTIGRMVWYWPDGRRTAQNAQPLSANVAYVHGDRLINIGYLDALGVAHSATSVHLTQDGDDVLDPAIPYCEWMPYQKGQAAKTEQLEALQTAKAARAAGPEGAY